MGRQAHELMVVAVMMGRALVGPSFRFERRLLGHHAQAQAAQHLVQDMIVLETQQARFDLQRHMAVAQVVGRAGQQQRVGATHRGHLLGRGKHLHYMVTFGVTEQLAAGCEALLKHILDLSRTLIARADPDAVPELLQNIVLTGGGSLVRGLGVALQTQLIEDGYENPKVSVIGPNYKEQVARGALKAARQAKDRQWQTILR